MANEVNSQPAANQKCRSCQAETGPMDRFCKACGALLMSNAGAPRAALKKRGRQHAAIMLLSGIAIVLFALLHRDPADVILVVALGLPLCGAGAVTWRMA